jgi:inorganic pyrophosphatase
MVENHKRHVAVKSQLVNAEFWIKLDRILAAHDVVIDRPKNSRHPRFPEIIYPFDYGYLKGTSSGDGHEIDVCRGTLGKNLLVAVICTVDILKQDTETKLLIDCTEEEIALVDSFYNNSEYMSGIILRRNF